MATTYTAANVQLKLTPNMQGFLQDVRRTVDQLPDGTIRIRMDDTEVTESLEGDGRGKWKKAAVGAGVAIGGFLAAGLVGSLDVSAAQSKLAAQLGGSGQRAGELGKVAGELYANAYGESLEDVNEAVRNVVTSGAVMKDATSDQIKSVTANVLDLSAAFGVDVPRATEAISAMVRNKLVPDAGYAADVITRMFQEFGPGAEDVLDTFQEYSVQFAKIGLDADFAGGLIAQAFRAGARDTDIAADALKEFSIRSIDGSKLTVDSFKAIGLNADEMRAKFAAGGPVAREAFGQVMTALRGVEDPAIRAEAAVGLFGTQAEDLGAALYAMDPTTATTALGDVAGAANQMGTTLADNATSRIETFKRSLQTGVTDFIGGQVLPALQGVGDKITSVFGPNWTSAIGPAILVAGGLAAMIFTVIGAMKLWEFAVSAWSVVTRVATAIQAAFNFVISMNPIGLVVIALVALVAGIIYAWNNFEGFRNVVQSVWGFLQGVASWVAGAFVAAWNWLSAAFVSVGQFFSDVWNNVLKPVFDVFWSVVSTTVQVIAAILVGSLLFTWDLVSAGFRLAYDNFIKPTFDFFAAIAQWLWVNVLSPVFSGIGSGFTAMGDMIRWVYDTIIRPVIDFFAQAAQWLWNSVLSPVFTGIRDGWSILGTFLSDFYTNIIAPIFGWFADRVTGFRDTFSRLVDGIKAVWETLRDAFKAPIRWVIETVWNGMVGALWNRAKTILPLGDFAGVDLRGWATGGSVAGPGTGTSDSILARLSDGEHVWTAAEVRAAGGHGYVESLRHAALTGNLPQFAAGGPVEWKELWSVVKNQFPGATLNSAFRKGDSGEHGAGRAIDVGGPMLAINRWLAEAFPGSHELIYTPGVNLFRGRPHTYNARTRQEHYDHVHWANVSKDGEGGGGGGGVWSYVTDILKGIFDTAAGGIRGLVSGIFPTNGTLTGDFPMIVTNKVLDTARDFLFGKAAEVDASGGGGGGAGVERWRGLVLQALQMLGLPAAYADITLRRMNQESGGNPQAINNWDINAKRGTPSKGLMQVIDPTFARHRDGRAPNNVWDPLANVLASMKYAMSQYGSLPAAYNRKGGYDNGGWLMPGDHQVYNHTGRPEPVFTADQWDVLRGNMGGGGDTYHYTVVTDDVARMIAEHNRQRDFKRRASVVV